MLIKNVNLVFGFVLFCAIKTHSARMFLESASVQSTKLSQIVDFEYVDYAESDKLGWTE